MMAIPLDYIMLSSASGVQRRLHRRAAVCGLLLTAHPDEFWILDFIGKGEERPPR
jgi:hypothetical protein